MSVENGIRVLAGSMVLLGTGLAIAFSIWWLALPIFVGVNLIQSAFTGFCPAEVIMKKFGMKGACCQAG